MAHGGSLVARLYCGRVFLGLSAGRAIRDVPQLDMAQLVRQGCPKLVLVEAAESSCRDFEGELAPRMRADTDIYPPELPDPERHGAAVSRAEPDSGCRQQGCQSLPNLGLLGPGRAAKDKLSTGGATSYEGET